MAKIHFVPHTHWDREWYLPFQLFRIKLVHLMDRLLDILERDPDFTHFTLDGQAILLEDYLEIHPEKFDAIQSYVQSGRLSIGPWYVLPDEFLVSPEALIRNLLIGKMVCARFGTMMKIGYLPDPFGHIGQLPQILNGFRINRAVFRRGLSDEPVELHWLAAAGSSVLVSYLRDGYDNAARAPEDPQAFQNFVRARVDSLQPHSNTSHFLLLNGSDHHEPQEMIPDLIQSLPLSECEITLSNLDAYFDGVETEVDENRLELPVITGELRDPRRHHLLPGTLSSRSWIKQRNHGCEILLERWAEPFTAWAELYRAETPDRSLWTGHLSTPFLKHSSAMLKKAWRLLLSCQPHDSICGCSIDQVHSEMRPRFDMVEQIAKECTRQSISLIADRVDGTHFEALDCRALLVVFNADPHAKSGTAIADLELPAGLDPFEIVDLKGNNVPYRILERNARSLAELELDSDGLLAMLALVDAGKVMGLAIQDVAVVETRDHTLIDVTVAENAAPDANNIQRMLPEIKSRINQRPAESYRLVAHFATEITMEISAQAIPAIGYQTYGLRPATDAVQLDGKEQAGQVLRNGQLELTLALDGSLNLHDYRTGRDFGGLLKLFDQADRGDSYTFCPVEGDRGTLIDPEVVQISNSSDGVDSRLVYELQFDLPIGLETDRANRSRLTRSQSARIEAAIVTGVPRVDLRIELDNQACDHRLKAIFPTGIAAESALYDAHYELVKRSTSIPAVEKDWAEQPVPEQPMRNYVCVQDGSIGLMVACRGLREASVTPEGEIGITLLRAFGWLSRDDLSTRDGGAGPHLPTPGGQQLGKEIYELAIIPVAENYREAAILADQFQTTMIAVGSATKGAGDPVAKSLVVPDNTNFRITAVKQPESGEGFIIRGVHLGDQAQAITLIFGVPFLSAAQLRMDETSLHALEILDGNRVRFTAEVGEVVTIGVSTS